MATVKGGDKFDTFLQDIVSKLGDNKVLRVGFLEGRTYSDGTSVAMVAAIQNYGAPSRGIPPRPFFSNVIANKSDGWSEILVNALNDTHYDVNRSLRILGRVIIGQIKDEINNGSFAPLKQATADRKGFSKPLIDTAVMLNSPDMEIKSA